MVEDKIKITGARILVKEKKLSEETASGIVIPGREEQKTNTGIVLKVGDGALLENGTRIPVDVKVGETVVYSSFSGSPVKYDADDKEEYIILNERDVLCVIE